MSLKPTKFKFITIVVLFIIGWFIWQPLVSNSQTETFLVNSPADIFSGEYIRSIVSDPYSWPLQFSQTECGGGGSNSPVPSCVIVRTYKWDLFLVDLAFWVVSFYLVASLIELTLRRVKSKSSPHRLRSSPR